jgi:hypothetical protein
MTEIQKEEMEKAVREFSTKIPTQKELEAFKEGYRIASMKQEELLIALKSAYQTLLEMV